ncbi:MAG: hypothetical protein ACRCZF_13430 [Gemmataceae bacterium]
MPWTDTTYTTCIPERYQLFHGAICVGVVECDGGAADFPQFWCGSLEMDPDVPDRFRTFFRLGWRWIESTGRTENAELLMAELASRFHDLWDTSLWRLVDTAGRDIPLVGITAQRGGMVSWVRVDGLDWGQIATPRTSLQADRE